MRLKLNDYNILSLMFSQIIGFLENYIEMPNKSKLPNPKKFSFIEMFNDSCGRTSLSKVMSFVVILVGCFGFVWGTLHLDSPVLASATAFVGAGSALLGIRRFTKDKDLKYGEDEDDDKKEMLHG